MSGEKSESAVFKSNIQTGNKVFFGSDDIVSWRLAPVSLVSSKRTNERMREKRANGQRSGFEGLQRSYMVINMLRRLLDVVETRVSVRRVVFKDAFRLCRNRRSFPARW